MNTTINEHVATLSEHDQIEARRIRERVARTEHFQDWKTGRDVDLHAQRVEHFFDGGPWELLCEDPDNGMLGKPSHRAVNSLGQTVFTFCREDLAQAYAAEYDVQVEAL